jgi:hypothetical protein
VPGARRSARPLRAPRARRTRRRRASASLRRSRDAASRVVRSVAALVRGLRLSLLPGHGPQDPAEDRLRGGVRGQQDPGGWRISCGDGVRQSGDITEDPDAQGTDALSGLPAEVLRGVDGPLRGRQPWFVGSGGARLDHPHDSAPTHCVLVVRPQPLAGTAGVDEPEHLRLGSGHGAIAGTHGRVRHQQPLGKSQEGLEGAEQPTAVSIVEDQQGDPIRTEQVRPSPHDSRVVVAAPEVRGRGARRRGREDVDQPLVVGHGEPVLEVLLVGRRQQPGERPQGEDRVQPVGAELRHDPIERLRTGQRERLTGDDDPTGVALDVGPQLLPVRRSRRPATLGAPPPGPSGDRHGGAMVGAQGAGIEHAVVGHGGPAAGEGRLDGRGPGLVESCVEQDRAVGDGLGTRRHAPSCGERRGRGSGYLCCAHPQERAVRAGPKVAS